MWVRILLFTSYMFFKFFTKTIYLQLLACIVKISFIWKKKKHGRQQYLFQEVWKTEYGDIV